MGVLDGACLAAAAGGGSEAFSFSGGVDDDSTALITRSRLGGALLRLCENVVDDMVEKEVVLCVKPAAEKAMDGSLWFSDYCTR